MLKAESLQQLAKRAGCSLADLKRLMTSESEETLTFESEGEFISNDDLDKIKERAGRESYAEAKRAGEEMLIKAIKTDEGLEFEGKTKENLIKALKDKIQKETGSEPTKRIQELEEDKKKLQTTLTEKETELTAEKERFNQKLTNLEIETAIKNGLPEKLANGLTREQAYKLYKSDREFAKTETGIGLLDPITKQAVKDKKLNPVSVLDDLKSFVDSFGVIPDQGRGGGDDKKKTNIESFTTRTEVYDYFEKNNIPLSDQASILAKSMKNEGFDINK